MFFGIELVKSYENFTLMLYSSPVGLNGPSVRGSFVPLIHKKIGCYDADLGRRL